MFSRHETACELSRFEELNTTAIPSTSRMPTKMSVEPIEVTVFVCRPKRKFVLNANFSAQ
jgi:hypothetical protein